MAEEAPERTALASALGRLDRRGDGSLDVEALTSLLRALDGETWSDEHLSQLFEASSAGANGCIQRDGFLDWLFDPACKAPPADSAALLLNRDFRSALEALSLDAPSCIEQIAGADDIGESLELDALAAPPQLLLTRQRSSRDHALARRAVETERAADLDRALSELREGEIGAALRFLGAEDLPTVLARVEAGDVLGAVRLVEAAVTSALVLERARTAGDAASQAAKAPIATSCPRGHPLAMRASKVWDYCDKCGWRPALGWCGGMERHPYAHCAACDFALCGECSGLAAARRPGARERAAQAALATLKRLCEETKANPSLRIHSTNFTVPTDECEGRVELHAFVAGPVVRQILSQGELCVCGAAATAAALNACTEQLGMRSKRLQLTWREILFDHFGQRLKLKVRDDDGDPASWKVGKTHIRTVIESFPFMKTRDLITAAEAVTKKRATAWKSLVAELRKPNTVLYFHTKGVDGHYTLIAGAVGPAPATADASPTLPYDPASCAILTNQVEQEPLQRVLFERCCDLIKRTKGFFRIFVAEYRPR
mmetsp:Transcript_118395/g.334634  ORF Transcript_118395/g.334634 Transcript_118395/m.334634 type:complete len:545 (+) Transcript_118395:81-1715(+)